MAHYQSITDYLLANGYVLDEIRGIFFIPYDTNLDHHLTFNWVAEMSNKHTVEEFAEIAVEKGWVTETQPANKIIPSHKPGNLEGNAQKDDEDVEEKKKKKPKGPWTGNDYYTPETVALLQQCLGL